MPLRDYQKQALDEIKHLFKQGCRRQILSMPTGLGKTVIFTRVHQELKLEKKVLVIAHRDELVQQAVKHYETLGYRFTLDRTDQWYENVSNDRRIWIATVQSLTHHLSRRVGRLNPNDFDLVICDEAHHGVASSYMSICRHFGITDKQFNGLFFGVTATPIRNDGQGLGQLFDKAVCVMDTFTAIEKGWLVGIRYLQAHSGVGLNKVPTKRSGDFKQTALGKRIDQDVRNSLIFKAWAKQAKAKRTIVFCATVEHASNVAKTFRDNEVAAQAIHGRLSKEERKRILRKHKNGNITVLANCEILTEGYDDRNIECIIMARPTESQLLYIQMIGRGLRLPEGIDNLRTAKKRGLLDAAAKTECTIIDVVDNCTRHDLEVVTALSLFGESVEPADAPPEGPVAPGPVVPPDGHAPATEVFEAVKAQIREIDLFAHRRRTAQPGTGRSPARPQQVNAGPLATWGEIEWVDEYKEKLHQKIVTNWESRPDGASCAFKRSEDQEYEAAISSCASGRWTLSVKATNGTPYSRTFRNLFDAFGCAEDFVYQQKQEIDQFSAPRRAPAVLPIQRCLLQICDEDPRAAQTFEEARRRIVKNMKRNVEIRTTTRIFDHGRRQR